VSTKHPSRRQLDLFGSNDPPHDLDVVRPRPIRVGAAEVSHGVLELARGLPGGLHFGTSSWSFPGWAGIVYDRAASPQELARDGLAAYAQHPLFRGVGIDRAYYAPLSAEQFAAYARVVPPGFRFLVKAHEHCTVARFPHLARYGSVQGCANTLFLDAAYARDVVVGPFVEGLGNAAGPLVFQFPPQPVSAVGGPVRFADRLQRFLQALPRGPLYAVELRTSGLLSAQYAAAIADTGACHCVSVHPTMPSVERQLAAADYNRAPATVVRWMLGGHQEYEAARDRYQPFDRIVDPDPQTRTAIARECVAALGRGRPAFVIINNKAEGSAPLSVLALARRVVEIGAAPGAATTPRS
jgi:uncharacterized protein YecE (DUF72 family)